jgi:hypothetical protein
MHASQRQIGLLMQEHVFIVSSDAESRASCMSQGHASDMHRPKIMFGWRGLVKKLCTLPQSYCGNASLGQET